MERNNFFLEHIQTKIFSEQNKVRLISFFLAKACMICREFYLLLFMLYLLGIFNYRTENEMCFLYER